METSKMDGSGCKNVNWPSSSTTGSSAGEDGPSGERVQLPSTAVAARPKVTLSIAGPVTTSVSNAVQNMPPSTGAPGPQTVQPAKNRIVQQALALPGTAKTSTSGQVQNLRIIQGPHGDVQVQGLLPGQQIRRLPDGRIQLLTLPEGQAKAQVQTIALDTGVPGQQILRLPDGQVKLLTMPGAKAKAVVKQEQQPPVRIGQTTDEVVSKPVHDPKQLQLERSKVRPQAQVKDVEQPQAIAAAKLSATSAAANLSATSAAAKLSATSAAANLSATSAAAKLSATSAAANLSATSAAATKLSATSASRTLMVASSLTGTTQGAAGMATAQVQIPVNSIAGKPVTVPAPVPAVTLTSPSNQPLSPVQQDLSYKSPLSKTDGASIKLSSQLKRKYLSMSQPSPVKKHRIAQKSPKIGTATKVMKSPKRKHKGDRTKQSTLLPFLRKMALSCHNTSQKVCDATLTPGIFGRNKVTSEIVNPLKDHKENNSPSTPTPSRVSTTPVQEQRATPLPGGSGVEKENVGPLKDHNGAVNLSSATVMEKAAYYQTPLHSEKCCDSLTTPRRKLFGECQGKENRSSKAALPFKKDEARLDYLPDLGKICDTVCDFPERKSNLASTKRKEEDLSEQCNASEPSDVDSALNKSEPSPDEPMKQSRNLPKLTEDQYIRLRDTFAENPYPSMAKLTQLAEDFGTSVLKVQIYFGGRRKTLRRKMMRRGISITSRQEMCLYAQDPERPVWGELLLKLDEADDKDYHIGQEASGGKYISILSDIGLDYVKSY